MRKLHILIFAMFFYLNISLAQGAIDVTIPNSSANSGESIEIPVTIGDISGQDVFSFDIWISFDENVLSNVSLITSGTISDSLNEVHNILTDEIRISAYNVFHPIIDSGTLFKLGFDVVGNVGQQTQLNFNRCLLNAGNPATNPQDGILMLIHTP